ncbi:MAG: hypothetical protein AB7Q37_07205 [Pyrinomonadaceae bacterium]
MSKEDKGKVKMTVIHFETESDNATLQANIHAIAQTLARALAPPPQRSVTQQLTGGNGAVQGEAVRPDDSDGETIDAEIIFASSGSKPSRQRSTPSSRSPIVLDLDLTSGETSLQAFYDLKKPDTENKRYFVIAAWFKEHREIAEVTMDHIHTAYRFLKLNTPKDASHPLRNLKAQGWMKKGADKGGYAVNHIGENEVNDMGK